MTDTKQTTFVEWPPEKKAAMAAAENARAQSTAHFHTPMTSPPAHPAHAHRAIPMMQPQAPTPGRPPQQARPIADPRLLDMLSVTSAERAAPAAAQPALAQVSAYVAPQVQALVEDAQAEQEYVAQIPNPTPGFVRPVSDAEYTAVALPSNFGFYAFKDLYVKPFTVRHLAKLQKAHREASLLPVVEAVSSVIYTSDPRYADQAIGFMLTLPDFYFVLYWLRLNSFTKSNYVHNTVCADPGHRQRVVDFESLDKYAAEVQAKRMTIEDFERVKATALPKESLKISQIFTHTDMKVNHLASIPDPDFYRFEDEDRLIFRPPTMRDTLEFTEHPKMADTSEREEFSYLAQIAVHLAHRDPSIVLTLDQKIQIIENLSGDQAALVKQYDKQVRAYGVEEKVRVTCKECGAARVSKLTLAAHSFLQLE
jgi:hypothetical protein